MGNGGSINPYREVHRLGVAGAMIETAKSVLSGTVVLLALAAASIVEPRAALAVAVGLSILLGAAATVAWRTDIFEPLARARVFVFVFLAVAAVAGAWVLEPRVTQIGVVGLCAVGFGRGVWDSL